MSEQRTELRAILSVGVSTGAPVQDCHPRVNELVSQRGGWLFRRELEGLWCSFPSLREAVRAAQQIFLSDPPGKFGFRFGLHIGDVTLTEEGDVLGHVLSVAKRLETAGASGDLWLSHDAAERLEDMPEGLTLEREASLALKGVGQQKARRIVFPPFGLADALDAQEWEKLRAGELVFCIIGPLGGPSELQPLVERWGGGDFYAAAEDHEVEYGRASLQADFARWSATVQPMPALTSALVDHHIPCLAFFPDPRLGHVTNLGSDVLTEADLDDLWARLPKELSGWETALTSHTVFWVGPADWVEIFHREVRRRFPAGPEQTQFLVQLGPPGEAARWRKRGFRVYNGLQHLTALATRLAQAEAASETPELASERPYRFLDSFGPGDRALFFGRDRETALLHSWILTRRWLVLYGRSGVGKSSLLGAGVLPLLQEAGVTVWPVRCLADPLAQLQSAERVRQICAECPRRLVIFFDQFEEFFVRLSHHERRPLVQLLQKLAGDPELTRLHLLFSLREDFLAELASLEEWIPTLLDSRFRLTALSREQARQCILGPAALFGLSIEEALVEELLHELEKQGVEPPELQIVMDRLWEERDGKHLGLENYRRLGGVRSILLEYLREALEGELAQGNWHPQLPRAVMRALVSERGTKSAQTLNVLLGRMAENPEDVQAVLDRLVDLRLARTLPGEEVYYELSHEYLIEEIQNWASEEELALRHASMVLQSELESWENLGSLISPDRLTMLARELPGRLTPTPEEFQLLLRASMVHGIPLLGLSGPQPEELLLRLLDEDWNGIVQRRVLSELAALPLQAEAQQRYLAAAFKHANPTLLERVRPALLEAHGENFYAAVAAAMRRRFFGPEAMAEVPAGPAWLGSDPEQREQRKSRLPRYWHARIDSEPDLHQVELPGFWIDRTPVTNLQFAEYRPAHIDRYPDEEDHHPVVSVSWFDAKAYADWLGKELVDEASWEKAARGPDGRLYPWGNDYEPDRLNAQETGLRSTSPVHDHPDGASPYGCLEMAGNVWEWTASAWSEGGPFKVQKGGSTLNPAPLQECSTRQEAFPDFVLQWVGFRLLSRRPC